MELSVTFTFMGRDGSGGRGSYGRSGQNDWRTRKAISGMATLKQGRAGWLIHLNTAEKLRARCLGLY